MVETMTVATRLHQCARVLAGQDQDRAREENGVGYSATDSSFGHALAASPPETWDVATTWSAYQVLRKYAGQLAEAGILFGQIPQPDAPPREEVVRDVRSIDFEGGVFVLRFAYDPAMVGRVRSIPQRRWNAPEKRWEVPQRSATFVAGFAAANGFKLTATAIAALTGAEHQEDLGPAGSIDLDDLGLVISFPYDRAMVDAVKSLPVRTWDADDRVWRAPVSAIRSVREFAGRYGLAMSEAVQAIPDQELHIAATIAVRGGQFAITFPFNRDLISRVSSIPGAAWSGKLGAWMCPLDAAYEVAEFAATGTMDIADSAVEAMAEARAALRRIAASAASAAELHIPGLGGTLRPFQAAGCLYSLEALGFTQQEDGTWAAA